MPLLLLQHNPCNARNLAWQVALLCGLLQQLKQRCCTLLAGLVVPHETQGLTLYTKQPLARHAAHKALTIGTQLDPAAICSQEGFSRCQGNKHWAQGWCQQGIAASRRSSTAASS
jgi:hypothetical protein